VEMENLSSVMANNKETVQQLEGDGRDREEIHGSDMARRLWSDCKESLLVVSPETVVRCIAPAFAWYWSMISKVGKRVGRRRISNEARDLIFRMVAENPKRSRTCPAVASLSSQSSRS